MRICSVLLVAFLFSVIPVSGQSIDAAERYAIIPYPAQLEPRAGAFILSPTTTIMVPFGQPDLKMLVEAFAHQINQSSGLSIPITNLNKTTPSGNLIQFLPLRDTTLGDEGYRLDITERLVTVEANHPKGFFYAIQTLYQLLPPKVLRKVQIVEGISPLAETSAPHVTSLLPPALSIPACRIQDRPRYVYRGMDLDVSRHFFSVAFVKKYLDLMALHKFNTFHWHLTDDQGWRIEIKKYPRLTQVGSHRRETIVGHYDDHDPQVFDGKPYGGFYTQDEIREVVQYAATKYITVVPEIELPGHAMAALASYPDLGCSPRSLKGETYQVATKWGVFDDVFCPTEKTFTFLQDVLTEVIALFPGKYIHIGGDECPKAVWRKNAYCQQLIKRLHLKNEHGLQSYFIKRIDQFVTSKGRRIIGWDEILEGAGPTTRLSPNATVMSWRGIKGGIEAARQRHDVIMTPSPFCYFDYYQGDPAQEPTAFGGSLPLEKVYSYNPTPTELTPEQATHILGAQGNIWTEYIDSPEQAEYMLWPRAAALAEVVWTPQAQRNYDAFARRIPTHFERLTNLNVNYARTFYDAFPLAKPTADGKVEVTLSTKQPPSIIPEIRYTLDGSIPSGKSPLYEKPIVLEKSTTIRTATFKDGKPLSQLAKIEKDYLVSKATGKSYTLLNAPTGNRPDKNYSLTDGTTGGTGGYEIAGIVTFTNDLNAVIDLGLSQPVERVRIGFLKYTARNVCLPKQVEISVSEDGTTFTPVLTAKTNAAENGKRAFVRLPFDFTSTTARYVRIIARNVGKVPAGLRNPGKAAKLAIDEIEVR
ncbi:glycoside hydrolase family 20 protein [Spirosoma validum]|uniref:beta-N-acetylhexosaminidase n=1 Tax=Spirosoma validum TaxID=2771355 RepID=A0A927AXL5_9BACT|nr:glycoside hydrolase family 20 protein [Spirosoma validum]MBD2751633.1 family 20 glycosylhydrolase [Spirosoma validum]